MHQHRRQGQHHTAPYIVEQRQIHKQGDGGALTARFPFAAARSLQRWRPRYQIGVRRLSEVNDAAVTKAHEERRCFCHMCQMGVHESQLSPHRQIHPMVRCPGGDCVVRWVSDRCLSRLIGSCPRGPCCMPWGGCSPFFRAFNAQWGFRVSSLCCEDHMDNSECMLD